MTNTETTLMDNCQNLHVWCQILDLLFFLKLKHFQNARDFYLVFCCKKFDKKVHFACFVEVEFSRNEHLKSWNSKNVPKLLLGVLSQTLYFYNNLYYFFKFLKFSPFNLSLLSIKVDNSMWSANLTWKLRITETRFPSTAPKTMRFFFAFNYVHIISSGDKNKKMKCM